MFVQKGRKVIRNKKAGMNPGWQTATVLGVVVVNHDVTRGRMEPRITRISRIRNGKINSFFKPPPPKWLRRLDPWDPRNPRLEKAVWQQFAGAVFFASGFK